MIDLIGSVAWVMIFGLIFVQTGSVVAFVLCISVALLGGHGALLPYSDRKPTP